MAHAEQLEARVAGRLPSHSRATPYAGSGSGEAGWPTTVHPALARAAKRGILDSFRASAYSRASSWHSPAQSASRSPDRAYRSTT